MPTLEPRTLNDSYELHSDYIRNTTPMPAFGAVRHWSEENLARNAPRQLPCVWIVRGTSN